MTNTQKLSIRLLREGLAPADAVREGVDLTQWDKLAGAMIALDTLGGGAPKWARFLELSERREKAGFQSHCLRPGVHPGCGPMVAWTATMRTFG